jgi:hypothetical protein
MPAPEPPSPGQWFLFGPWAFDITAAQAIIASHPRRAASLPVEPWARAYGMDRQPGSGTIPLLGPGPAFDREYAMGTDLTVPVIVATMPAVIGPLLIDGTHRLYKAHVLGIAALPAWVLTGAETLKIRAPRGSRAARRPGTGRSGR